MSDIQDGSAVFTVRDKRAQAFVDLVYPVGIVIALANDKKPAFMQYGTWEKVAEDRVLQGASESNTPGKKIEPGLPNITGYVYGGIKDYSYQIQGGKKGGFSGSRPFFFIGGTYDIRRNTSGSGGCERQTLGRCGSSWP